MKPGRYLDLLIAEKVMGLAVLNGQVFRYDSDYKEGETARAIGGDPDPYSTDISAAWKVVERIAQNYHKGTGIGSGYSGNGFILEHCTEQSEDKWLCRLPSTVCSPPYEEMDPDAVIAEGETAPLAICLAALRVVEQ